MKPEDRWSADEVESCWVACVCVGMMSFGMVFYIIAKVVTHQVFTRCLSVGCSLLLVLLASGCTTRLQPFTFGPSVRLEVEPDFVSQPSDLLWIGSVQVQPPCEDHP